MSQMVILGAVYGTRDVTEKVRSMVLNNTLTITANNHTFGDPWPGTPKSLVIVYQYGALQPQVRILQENATETINEGGQTLLWKAAPKGQLSILGAAYGLADVTPMIRSIVAGERLNVVANNSTFGDSWVGVPKTLVVVYTYGDKPLVKVVKENERMTIQHNPHLRILGATYGPADVTAVVAGRVDANQELRIMATNDIFRDPWIGHRKALVVVFQYGDELPQTAIVQEGAPLTLTYIPQPHFEAATDPNHLVILGAAYGLGNVTNRIVGLVHDNALLVTADNQTFGDLWPGIVKTLTVVFQFGTGPAKVQVCKENERLGIGHVPAGTR